jgi:hypothetical protein
VGRSRTIGQKLLARGISLVAVCGAAVTLAGCGGIEFQGKVFDYAGLSGSGSKEDVRMTERAPLLIPPDTRRLPPPGPEAVTPVNWPVDSDLSRKQAADAKAAAEQKAEAEASPDVPYAGKPKLLDHWLGKDKPKSDGLVDVPEPDPSDKTAEDRAREQGKPKVAQKPVDHSLDAPPPPDDPFHPAAPDSYKGMSSPAGNNASW